MVDTMKKASLVKLDDSGRELANPGEDVRGRKVFDRSGEEIGKVDEIFVDDREGKVRFLQIGSGGFLGMGQQHFLIPVDAVSRIEADNVYIDQTRERITGAPAYDPTTVPEHSAWNDLYGYYGYAPYWNPGYVDPRSPR